VGVSIYNTKGRNLVFDGDSFFDQYVGTPVVVGGQYIPTGVYGNVISGRRIATSRFGTSGDTLAASVTNFNATVGTVLKSGDVVVIQCVTNDLGTNLQTAAQAYASLTTYCGLVHALGATVVVCTMTARDKVGDPADIETQRLAYNALVVANSPAIADGICNVGADPMFDTQADCSNGTNYNADKLHLNTAGQNNYITLLSATLNSFL